MCRWRPSRYSQTPAKSKQRNASFYLRLEHIHPEEFVDVPAPIPPRHAQKTVCCAATQTSPSSLLAPRRRFLLQTHALTYDTLQGNSWQLVSWVCGINSRQSTCWVLMGRLDGSSRGSALIGPAATWRQEDGNKAGVGALEARQWTGDPSASRHTHCTGDWGGITTSRRQHSFRINP